VATRTVTFFEPFPIYVERGPGCTIGADTRCWILRQRLPSMETVRFANSRDHGR
jgi:hypothetical protein